MLKTLIIIFTFLLLINNLKAIEINKIKINNQNVLLKILNEQILNEEIWYKYNKKIYKTEELEKEKQILLNNIQLNIDIWKSAKATYKELKYNYLGKVLELKLKLKKTKKEKNILKQITYILDKAILHKDIKINKQKLKMNLLLIENLLTKYKIDYQNINLLFNKKWIKKYFKKNIFNKNLITDYSLSKEYKYDNNVQNFILILKGETKEKNIVYITETPNITKKICINNVIKTFNIKKENQKEKGNILISNVINYNYPIVYSCFKNNFNNMINVTIINLKNKKNSSIKEIKNILNQLKN